MVNAASVVTVLLARSTPPSHPCSPVNSTSGFFSHNNHCTFSHHVNPVTNHHQVNNVQPNNQGNNVNHFQQNNLDHPQQNNYHIGTNNVFNFNAGVMVQFARNEINYYNTNVNTYIAKLCQDCPLVQVNKQCDCYFESAGKHPMAIPPPAPTAKVAKVHYGVPTPMTMLNHTSKNFDTDI
ncbi:MAG: proteasome regulatory particle base subunit [Watsoniomyces obsoletus]|nr:MAG: proteasome regulatory particle base subunit [Watsoniomyces obsoletus]